MAGRFAGTWLMRYVKPSTLLALYSLINILLLTVALTTEGKVAVYSVVAVPFFMSIMFPTIFALAVKDLGHHTKKGSSFLIMSIVGGACMPYVMGVVAENYSTALSYLVPLFCFIHVAWYGWRGYRVKV